LGKSAVVAAGVVVTPKVFIVSRHEIIFRSVVFRFASQRTILTTSESADSPVSVFLGG